MHDPARSLTRLARRTSFVTSLAGILAVTLVAPIAASAAAPPRERRPVNAVVLVSANAEWRVVKDSYPRVVYQHSPWGEFFETTVATSAGARRVVFLHGGWGKVAAAASAQYAIDRWNPATLVNLGTCGGFAGDIERFAIVLADRTLIYDIKEAMGDSSQAIADYATPIDLAWLGPRLPAEVRQTLLVSADRDLVPAELSELKTKYGAVAGDWESGAIAYTCARNARRVLILRGVSDLVTSVGGEAYGDTHAFEEGTRVVMTRLLRQLPKWLARVK